MIADKKTDSVPADVAKEIDALKDEKGKVTAEKQAELNRMQDELHESEASKPKDEKKAAKKATAAKRKSFKGMRSIELHALASSNGVEMPMGLTREQMEDVLVEAGVSAEDES